MATNTIDAALVQKMFLAGAKNLESKKEWINDLNVFPVPDGDTGTNMTLTIMSAAKEVISVTPFISFVKPLKSCDKITPELPLAPLNEPDDIALERDEGCN